MVLLARILGLPLSVLLVLAANSADGQVTNPTEFTQGPLSFSALSNSQYVERGERLVNGIVFRDFTLTASTGKFSCPTDNRFKISGIISDLDLEGSYSLEQGPNKPVFTVAAGKLKFTLVTTQPFSFIQYGGTLTVPTHSKLELTNLRLIRIYGSNRLNQAGLLQIVAPTALGWTNVQFNWASLPNALTMNLSAGNASPTIFELPLETDHLHMTSGNFYYSLPRTATTASYDLKTDGYHATIHGIRLASCSIRIERDKLNVALTDLNAMGEFTAFSKSPILFRSSLLVAP